MNDSWYRIPPVIDRKDSPPVNLPPSAVDSDDQPVSDTAGITTVRVSSVRLDESSHAVYDTGHSPRTQVRAPTGTGLVSLRDRCNRFGSMLADPAVMGYWIRGQHDNRCRLAGRIAPGDMRV